ncbi:copper amine oxidase N-terminal domain-containing protein [Marinicrinis sediminis]|uniref:Copper amine oxidase N-terminal domain-containing protein n=1 Tax=Marinicrinis sediminis TaxID=1652465 RepID=A0ABW5RFB9_9BACL
MNRWQRFIPAIIILLWATATAMTGAAAEKSLELYVNGNDISEQHQPVIEEARMLFPLRGLAEEAGASIRWEPEKKHIYIDHQTIQISAQIGSSSVIVNGREQSISIAPQIMDDRTYVPVRFISETLGARVEWFSELRCAIVTFPHQNETYFEDPFLSMAREGQLKNCSFSLTDKITAEEVREELGEPTSEGTFGGSYYLQYEACMYLFSVAKVQGETGMQAPLIGIDHQSTGILADPDTVKQYLGQPVSEGYSELSKGWSQFYELGDYDLYITFDSQEGSVRKVRLNE